MLTRCFLFTLRLSHSGKAAHRVFASQGQEAFIEGHVHAFEVLGGVPCNKVRYDNLQSAVSRVLFGRNRLESDQWVAFLSHYGFDELGYLVLDRRGAELLFQVLTEREETNSVAMHPTSASPA